jgi:hypothetical protein
MKEIFLILLILFFASSLQAGTIYKWVDKEGVLHFTDDLTQVPPSYLEQVETEESKDVKGEATPSAPQAVTRESKEEETTTDIYGRDEDWWREKVRPWKERLKEANENLDRVKKEFAEKTEEMARKGLVSRARYQIETKKYNEEKMKYEAQITEAKEMLAKLSKEATESKANPDWLK